MVFITGDTHGDPERLSKSALKSLHIHGSFPKSLAGLFSEHANMYIPCV